MPSFNPNYTFNSRQPSPQLPAKTMSKHSGRAQDTVEDWQRDLPQALLFPHSLDTAAPGRQVLLRHQRVLRGPPPTPPPTGTTSRMSVEDWHKGKEGDEYSPAASKMSPRVERWRDRWSSFKQRVTPTLFPYAWLFFLMIISIAAGAMVAGWYGLAAETVRHQTLSSASSTAAATRQPAPPNLEAGALHITGTDLQLHAMTPELAETAITTATALSPRSDLPPYLTQRAEDELKTTVVDEYITTVYVTTTLDPGPQTQSILSLTSNLSATTASSTSSAPSTLSTSSTSTNHSVTAMDTVESTSTTTSATALATTNTLMYCPNPMHPDIWTLCSYTAESSATLRTTNPFTTIRLALSSWWNAATGKFIHLDNLASYEMFHTCSRPSVGKCESENRELYRKLRTAADLVRTQQRLLNSHNCLLEEQRLGLAQVVHVLGTTGNGTFIR